MTRRRIARRTGLPRKAFIAIIVALILSLFLLVRSTSIANQAQAAITSAVQNLQVDPWGRVVDVTFNSPVTLSFPDDNTRFEIDLVRPLGRDVNFGVGDVNGDGITDLFGRSFDGVSFFYPGLDSHPFRFGKAQLVSKLSWDECPYAEFGEGAVWEGVAFADFDGDGVKDVVLGHKIYSMVMPNEPTLLEEVYTLEVDHTWDLFPAAGDLDGDDKPDIIMTAGAVSQNTYLHRNQSTPGNFSFQRELLTDHYRPDTSFIGTRGLSVADINNDGLHDLTCFHGVYFNQGTTTNPVFDFNNPTAYTVSDGPWVDGVNSDQGISIFMFDGDGDGLVDAYVSNYGTSVWQGSFYKNVGSPSSPSFEFQSPILCQSTPYDNSYRGDDEPSFSPRDIYVSTGDINRDGLLDILVSDGSGTFSESTVLWNRSTGDSEPHFSCMDIYTFFTDGYPDINPYSFFTQNWLPNVVLAWKDYTGDGLEDIIKTDAFMQAFNLYFLERQTDYPIRFYSEQLLTTVTGAGMNGIGLAEFDLDNDGSNDFVFGLSNGQLACHRNLGTNHGLIFDDQVLLTDPALTPIDIGENSWPVEFDWDDDGDSDLLVGAQSGKISILVNQNGRFTDTGYLGAEEWDPLDLAPNVIGGGLLSPVLDAVDFNNDQLVDVLGGGHSPPCIWYFENIGSASPPNFADNVISVDRTIPGYVEKISDSSYRLYFGIPVLPEETSVFFYGDLTENQPAVRLISTMPNTVLISGNVSTNDAAGSMRIQAAGLSGVVMDGLPGNPVTDASGNYSATADYGFSGTVTPTLAGYTFSPPSRDYTDVTSDQTNHNYTATIIQCTLTIAAGTGGTTNPTPGSYPYNYGTQVQVTAVANSGYQFSGWTGDASGTTSSITVTMDADKSITATFSSTQTGGSGNGDGGGQKKGCFIATAAYGSPFHPHLDTLRDFRDKYLMPSGFGRKLVELYYRYSPSIADLIAKHGLLKVAVRISLLPVITLSYSAVHLGSVITGLLLISIAVIPIFLLGYIKRILA